MTNKTTTLVLICALLAPAGPAEAEEVAGEQLLFVSPPKWTEVYSGREANLSTTEYVPQSQTLEKWEEMLTVQIVLGLADADPETILAKIAVHVAEECHEFDAKPIELGGAGDYPTLAVMLLCGAHSKSRGGEFSLLRGIAGNENFYLLRKTWRTDTYVTADDPPIALNDRRFWLGFLAYQRVCNPALDNCPKQVDTAQ